MNNTKLQIPYQVAIEYPQAIGKLLPPGEWARDALGSWFLPRVWQIVIRCPFCGRKHMHGWPSPDDPGQFGGEGSTRRSHCTPGGTYQLTAGGAA